MGNVEITCKQSNSLDIIENCFKLNEKQTRILYSIESLLVQKDIDKSKSHIFAKEHWLTKWQNTIKKFIGDFGLVFPKTISEIISTIKKELEEAGENKWLKMALLEASLFVPYYPLTSDEKSESDIVDFTECTEEDIKLAEERVKAKNKELFEAMKSYDTDFEILSEISITTLGEDEKDYPESCKKTFNKNQDIISDRLKKNVFIFGGAAVGATVLAVVSAGMAGPIAVALVGSGFPGLTGAALTSASLAAIGGGAIAAGGAGMAGGAALVVGGGAILGLVGGGGAVISAEALRSINKGTFNKADLEAMIQSLSKLVTVTVKVLDSLQNYAVIIENILSGIRDIIRAYRDIADDMELGIGGKPKKDSLSYINKIIDALKKTYEIIQKLCQKEAPVSA